MTTLVDVWFEQELWGDPNRTVETKKYWYHVPRVGDLIALDELQGKVKSVTWLADHVLVRLQGKVGS